MDLDDLYRVLRSAHVQAQGIVDTIRDPLLVLDAGLKILSANPAFYKTFRSGRDDVLGKSLSELGDGQWNIPELMEWMRLCCANRLMAEVPLAPDRVIPRLR